MDKQGTNKIMTSTTTIVENVTYSFMFVGVILLIVTIWVSSVACTISAYSFLGVSVALILSLILTKLVKGGSMNSMKSIFLLSPILLLVGIFIYVLYLLTKHYDQIDTGNVTPFYSQIMNSTTFLVLIQIYIIVSAMQTEEFKKTYSIGMNNMLFMLFMELLNIILLILLGINLTYFVTDG